MKMKGGIRLYNFMKGCAARSYVWVASERWGELVGLRGFQRAFWLVGEKGGVPVRELCVLTKQFASGKLVAVPEMISLSAYVLGSPL